MNPVARDMINLYLLSFFSYFLLFFWLYKTQRRDKIGYLIFLSTCWLVFAMPLLWNGFLRQLIASGVRGEIVTGSVFLFMIIFAVIAFIHHGKKYKNVSMVFKRNVYGIFFLAVIVANLLPVSFDTPLFYTLQIFYIISACGLLVVIHKQKITISYVTDFYIIGSVFLMGIMYLFKSLWPADVILTVVCGCMIMLFIAFLIFSLESTSATIVNRDDKIKAAEAIRYYLSNYDELTQLKNKNALQADLDDLLAVSEGAWLLLISISNIANIKNYLGITSANEIICEIAEVIVQIAQNRDNLYFYENGSFININFTSEKEFESFCVALSQRIADTLQSKTKLKVMVEFAATYMKTQKNCEQLLKELHLALLQKDCKATLPCYFNPVHQIDFENDIKIHALIEEAIAQRNIEVWYQPKINLLNGEISGFEALVRIPTVNGYIMPGIFIPIAEKFDLIVDLGYLIIEKAFAFCVLHSIRQIININLSVKQILDENFASMLDKLLRKYELSPLQIIFEITETSLMEDFAQGLQMIHHLRKVGFGISLDDFGTGYSSFSYLADIPITEIKLDRSLLMGFEKDMKKHSLIRSIIQIAAALGIDLVVEGIETLEQLNLLTSFGCRWGQGYYFYKPMPEAKVLNLLGVAAV